MVHYYLGYINKEDGLMTAFGPYYQTGWCTLGLIPMLTSQTGSLCGDFEEIPHEMYSDQLQETNEIYRFHESDDKKNPSYCRVKDLTDESPVKSGYFLIDEVNEYLKTHDSASLREYLDPVAYSGRVDMELKIGNHSIEDSDDNIRHSTSQYMYFTYIDTHCEAYQSFILKEFVSSVAESGNDNDKEYVIIATEE